MSISIKPFQPHLSEVFAFLSIYTYICSVLESIPEERKKS